MGGLVLIVLAWIGIVFLSYAWLTKLCYLHVKEQIRSELYAAHGAHRSRATRRRRSDDDGLYQPSLVRLANPGKHVWLIPQPLFLAWPSRHHLLGVVVRWTPLVAYPTEEWLDELARCVAHFLAVSPMDLERADVNLRRRRIRIVRAAA